MRSTERPSSPMFLLLFAQLCMLPWGEISQTKMAEIAVKLLYGDVYYAGCI